MQEWKGTWSDGSAVWQFVPEGEKERIGLDFDDQDGEFYMSQVRNTNQKKNTVVLLKFDVHFLF